jgi:hypothetical protein
MKVIPETRHAHLIIYQVLIINYSYRLEQTTYIAIGAGSGVTLILPVVLILICLRFVKISCTLDV